MPSPPLASRDLRRAETQNWEHAVAVRKAAASVFAAVCLAAMMVASSWSFAQTAPGQAPAQKSKASPKSPTKAQPAAEGEDGEQAAARKKRDPAEAQRQIDTGIKLLQDGKAEPAIQMLTAATNGGGLPPQQMGRALYHRGMAYRKAGKPAQAISDLTSALWLKNGLSEADRADALKQRSEAYREAGLPDQTDSEGKVSGAKATRSANAASGGEQAKAATPAPATSTNFLAGLFGGNKTPPAPPAAEPAQKAASPAPKSDNQTSGWSSQTRPARTADPARAATVTAPAQPAAPEPEAAPKTRQRTAAAPAAAAAPPPPSAKPDGKFRARVALVRSRSEAEAIVARLRVQHAAAIGSAEADVSEASFGNMGTFFQVRVGPFAREADATGVCARLKGSGLDCVPVDR